MLVDSELTCGNYSPLCGPILRQDYSAGTSCFYVEAFLRRKSMRGPCRDQLYLRRIFLVLMLRGLFDYFKMNLCHHIAMCVRLWQFCPFLGVRSFVFFRTPCVDSSAHLSYLYCGAGAWCGLVGGSAARMVLRRFLHIPSFPSCMFCVFWLED